MSFTTLGCTLLAALLACISATSLSAALPTRARVLDDLGPTRGGGGPPLAAHLRRHAVAAGLALGMAATVGRTMDRHVDEPDFHTAYWAETLTPTRPKPHPALRVDPIGTPR